MFVLIIRINKYIQNKSVYILLKIVCSVTNNCLDYQPLFEK